ncbi:MAG: superoxide dismutase [Planctomycetota bacterium]
MNRREALGALGLTAAGTLAMARAGQSRADQHAGEAGTHGHGQHGPTFPGYDAAKGEYVLPDLPYAYGALEAAIDEQTMRIHHTKHHAGYVRGLNKGLTQMAEARASGDFASIRALSRNVAFAGGGHALHTLFWQNMAPAGQGGGGEPDGKLSEAIARDFGSYAAFKAQFVAAASGVMGSGWGMLVQNQMSGQLIVLQGELQHELTQWLATPLLVIDVWEHAYYLRYQNRRADYVQNFFEVVNWSAVAERMAWHG